MVFLFIVSARQISVCAGRFRFHKDNSVPNSSPIRRSITVDGDCQQVTVGAGFKLYVFCCFYVLFVQVVVLGFDGFGLIRKAVDGKVVDWFALALPAAQCLAWFVLSFSALHCKFKVYETFLLFLREPLLLEEEAGSLKVTPYSDAGLFSLAENQSEQPSLAWAIWKSFWKEAACNVVFALLNTLVSYVSLYMISYFVDYLGGRETFPHEALTTMVYHKGLKLSSLAKQSHTSGEIVNYIAVDVQRVRDYSWYLHDIWMLPLEIILSLVQEDYQDKLMAAKDERMRCLRIMRILKSQAWEDKYRIRLEEMRGVEFTWLRKALYSQAFVTFIFWSSLIFVAAITFATSILLGGQLTAGSVFFALATFRILQEPLRNFPDLVYMMAQTKVSIDRISGFLQEDATIVLPRGMSKVATVIKDGEFCWDPSSSRPTLSGIQMKVESGMRMAVCGTVGSGKSSFLSCILGEIPKISGEKQLQNFTLPHPSLQVRFRRLPTFNRKIETTIVFIFDP
ncbi:ABC transporter C family member 13 [Hibiscus syriacus]|uniref:ABC transporter C family member 13 n=1 Tax=Hibiscus syriacus TaxID=106335 RepID=A0A6A2ZMN1_HIBSY|nr:ABC transporter C family member 13 [Hibiscus syriacus]